MSDHQQMQTAARRFNEIVEAQTTQLIAGLPMSVPDRELKRARAQLRVAFSQHQGNSKIYQCTPGSIATCIAMSAVTGLFPGGPNPDIDIIPRRIKNGPYVLLWQVSFRGYVRLCRRNLGWDLKPVVVFDCDEFDVVEGDQPRIHHKPNILAQGEILQKPETAWNRIQCAYALVERPGAHSFLRFEYLLKPQLQARRDCAETQAIWAKWPVEMALKTICRYAGQREAFPTDDPTRYALANDAMMEVGAAGGSFEDQPERKELPQTASTSSGMDRVAAVLGEKEPAGGEDEGSKQKEKPEGGPPWETITEDEAKETQARAKKLGINVGDLFDRAGIREGVGNLKELPAEDLQSVTEVLDEIAAKKEGA